MAEDKENPVEGEDGQEEREAPSAGGAPEAAARQVVEKTFDEPADDFDSIAYLKEFYPAMDVALGLRAIQAIADMEKTGDGKTVIDLRRLQEVLGREADTAPGALEALENYCIDDFMIRQAVPAILRDRPDDHLRILDVGGGPTIYQHIPLMGIADSIVHSEFSPANREEVKRWKEGTSAFDWRSFFAFYQSYAMAHPEFSEGADPDVRERLRRMAAADPAALEDELREKITEVLPVDVFREDLGMGRDVEADVVHVGREGSAQLVTSNFCIESATPSLEAWRQGIGNVAAKVPLGGFLLMTAIRNAKWYKVGDRREAAAPVDAEMLSAELRKQGLEIRSLSEVVGSEQEVMGYDGMVFVLAKRVSS